MYCAGSPTWYIALVVLEADAGLEWEKISESNLD